MTISPRVAAQQATPVIATETLALEAEGVKSKADGGVTFVDHDSVASRHHLNCTTGASYTGDVEKGMETGPALDIGRSQQWVTTQFKQQGNGKVEA